MFFDSSGGVIWQLGERSLRCRGPRGPKNRPPFVSLSLPPLQFSPPNPQTPGGANFSKRIICEFGPLGYSPSYGFRNSEGRMLGCSGALERKVLWCRKEHSLTAQETSFEEMPRARGPENRPLLDSGLSSFPLFPLSVFAFSESSNPRGAPNFSCFFYKDNRRLGGPLGIPPRSSRNLTDRLFRKSEGKFVGSARDAN